MRAYALPFRSDGQGSRFFLGTRRVLADSQTDCVRQKIADKNLSVKIWQTFFGP